MSSIKDKINKIELAEKNLERTIQWVPIIDSKALFILTLILAILSYIFTKFDAFIALVFSLYERKEIALITILCMLTVLQLIGFITSAIYLILIIHPKRTPYTQEYSSMFFFETISNMTMSNFDKNFKSITMEEAIEGINDQTYNNAKIIKKKFDQLSISIKWFSLGLIVFFLYMITQAVLSEIYI